MSRLILVLATTWLACGCSTVSFSEQSREQIREVSVLTDVELHGSYKGRWMGVDPQTRGANWYVHWATLPVGVVYDLIDWNANKERRSQALMSRIDGAEIDVASIARREVEKALDSSDVFDRVVACEGDAQIVLEVDYGFDDGLGLRGSWKLWMEINAQLVDPQGNIHWKRTESIDVDDSRLPEYHRPLAKPDSLRSGFRKAARLVSKQLAEHLRG